MMSMSQKPKLRSKSQVLSAKLLEHFFDAGASKFALPGQAEQFFQPVLGNLHSGLGASKIKTDTGYTDGKHLQRGGKPTMYQLVNNQSKFRASARAASLKHHQ